MSYMIEVLARLEKAGAKGITANDFGRTTAERTKASSCLSQLYAKGVATREFTGQNQGPLGGAWFRYFFKEPKQYSYKPIQVQRITYVAITFRGVTLHLTEKQWELVQSLVKEQK